MVSLPGPNPPAHPLQSRGGRTAATTHAARKALTLILYLMPIPAVALSQAQPQFTVDHVLQFETGTDQDRQELSIIDPSRMILVKSCWPPPCDQRLLPFKMAREDLNDDGAKELILMSTSPDLCKSGTCMTSVFENRGGTVFSIMSGFPMLPRLAVTKEKLGSSRVLVPVDDHGEIVLDETPGPRFGKQIVYFVRAGSASARPTILNPEACGGDPHCTEVPTFVAMVTEFRLDLVRGSRIITATVRFVNKLDRSLVVGYVQGSGTVTDDQGNRYSAGGSDAVSRIGEIVGEHPDPEFRLSPGDIGDARFKFRLQSGSQALGTQYTIDLTVGEIVPIPSEALVRLFGKDEPDADSRAPHEWQPGKVYPLRFSGFTDAGMTPSVLSNSTPAGAKLTGAYMSKPQGGQSWLERLTFTSGNEVVIEDGVARRMGAYVMQGRTVTVSSPGGFSWVFTIDGKGCLIGDMVNTRGVLCRQ